MKRSAAAKCVQGKSKTQKKAKTSTKENQTNIPAAGLLGYVFRASGGDLLATVVQDQPLVLAGIALQADLVAQAGRDGRAALKIALTTDRNNQAEARGTAVGALKSDLARRLEDVQALGEAVQTKIAALAEPQNEDQHERLVKDLGDMQAMVRQHNRRIRELQQTRKVQVTYQRTRTSRQTVLEPGVPCRVPFLLDSELLVMWCPIVLRTEGAH